jgi:L-fuconolactonase
MAAADIHVPVREEWLAQGSEAALDPHLPIVDAHHHLWDRPSGRYLYPELLSDIAAGHNIRATVYVQCRSMYRSFGPDLLRPVGEVEFANGIAAQAASGLYGDGRACAGIVGFADLALGDQAIPVLEALLRAGGDRLKGIRVPVVWHESPDVVSSPARPPQGLMAAAGFRQGVRRLADYRLSLDIWAYHTQLREVLALAQEVPSVTIVVDHCGGPIGVGPYTRSRAEVFAEWQASLRQLASLPNIVMKFGGLGMQVAGFEFHHAPHPPSSQQLADAWRPYFEVIMQTFGASRCMFESNFPVDKGMFSYATFWNACKRLSAGASPTERDALFAGTAMRVYRLPSEEILP